MKLRNNWRTLLLTFLTLVIAAGILLGSFAGSWADRHAPLLSSNQVEEGDYVKALSVGGKSLSAHAYDLIDRYGYLGEHQYVAADSDIAGHLIDEGMKGSFRSDYLVTTVFLVSGDASVTSFHQLLSSDTPIFISRDDNLRRHLASASWALRENGNPPTRAQLSAVLKQLAQRQEKNHLYLGTDFQEFPAVSAKYPVAIMTDLQAVNLIRGGFKGKIVVPQDGTLTFGSGIFAAAGSPLPQVDLQKLTQSGFRTVDASGQIHSQRPYPAEGNYLPAKYLAGEEWYSEVAQHAVADFRRSVMGIGFISPLREVEYFGVYLTLIAIAIAWGASLSWRAPTRALAYLFSIQVLLIVGFCLHRMVKLLSHGVGERYLWYAFYFFILANVTVLVIISERASWSQRKARLRRTWVAIAGSLLVFSLVLTNDLHQWVFHFEDPTDWNDGGYTYGWGAVVVALWILCLLCYAGIRFYLYSRTLKNLTFAALGSFIVIVGTVLLVGHSLGLRRWAVGFEVVLVHAILMMVVPEILIQTGLIPSNWRYLKTFRRTTVPFFLLDRNWNVVNRTRTARQIPPQVIRAFQAGQDQVPASALPASSQDAQAIDYRLTRLEQGYAVFEYDMSPVRALRESLEVTRRELHQQYRTLEDEVQTYRQLESTQARNNLFTLVEDVMRIRLGWVEQRLTQLKQMIDGKRPQNVVQTQRILRLIGMHLGYCKRAGLVALGAKGQEGNVPIRQLRQALSDTCSDFSRYGDLAQVRFDSETDICEDAVGLLDAFHTVLEAALEGQAASVLLNVRVSEKSWQVRALIGDIRRSESQWKSTFDRLQDSYQVKIWFEDPDWQVSIAQEAS